MSEIGRALKAGLRIEYSYVEGHDEDERYQAILTDKDNFHLHITASSWDGLLDEVNEYCETWNCI